jgi:hypothetical protein
MNLLWSQWRALGVPAATRASTALIDPEALLIETAVLTHERPDARVRDGAIAWAARYHGFIATTRLKRLLDRRDEPAAHAFKEMARQVSDHAGRLSWPMSDRAEPWNISVNVSMPKLDESAGLLRLRARGMFGANARAEAVAYLACLDGPVELAMIERDTLFSRKQLSDALDGLVHANWVLRSTLGNALRFELSALARLQLRLPMRDLHLGSGELDVFQVASAPARIDWDQRYRLMRVVAGAASALEAGDLITALAALRRTDDEFSALSLPAPAPVTSEESDEHVRARVTDWIERANTRLTGPGLLP